MNPLDFDCQQCRAKAGQRCRNYLGKGKQTCKARGNAQAFDRAAARKNRKAQTETPLFALIDGPHTAESEYRHWRRNVALAAERVAHVAGLQLLDVLRLLPIRRCALALVGPEAFAKLDAYCRHVLPFGHWYGFWCGALTGKRVVFAVRRVEDRRPGQPAVVDKDWHEHAHMTREEYYARFPFTDPEPVPVDDGGLAAALESILQRMGSRQ